MDLTSKYNVKLHLIKDTDWGEQMNILNAEHDRLLYEVEQFLINNHASDYLHYFLKSMYPRITSGEIILILAPTDDALQRLVDKSGKTLEEIASLPEGRNILTNFLSSSTLIREDPPVYTAINGAFLNSAEDFGKLGHINIIQLGNLTVEAIDGVITMPGQLEKLQQVQPSNMILSRSNIIGDNYITNFDDLPNPVIRTIVLNLSLTDIVSNCRINIQFNSTICNNDNFWNEKTRKDFPERQVIIRNNWKTTYRILSKRLYTFGKGNYGQLGQGDMKPQFVPTLVQDLVGVTMIACGGQHMAAISNRQLYTWGLGEYGRLGHGDAKDHLKPKLVEELDNVTSVACGGLHTVVISNGKLYAFGFGYSGQLGHGNRQEQRRPGLVGGGLDNVTMVACGGSHTAVIANGQLYTFGRGEEGQLGHGDREYRYKPKLVEGLNNVTFVACGTQHTAAISNGQLYTFGAGEKGQLGHGDKRDQLRPKSVEGLDNVIMVSGGNEFTAAISNGKLYSFGRGPEGRLGHGNEQDQLRPKLVDGLDNVIFVACGSEHTAVISGSHLYTYGCTLRSGGPLGYINNLNQRRPGDSIQYQLTPRLVEELNGVIYVACGFSSTAAIAD